MTRYKAAQTFNWQANRRKRYARARKSALCCVDDVARFEVLLKDNKRGGEECSAKFRNFHYNNMKGVSITMFVKSLQFKFHMKFYETLINDLLIRNLG